MLQHLRYVDHIKNGEILIKKLFEILELEKTIFQQIIIECIPDLVDVTRHNDIIKKLM